MDRTILITQRAEEKHLSELLHKKLQGLALIHPPTDECRKYIKSDMFLKPNPQAFFHIMHYLFCILDAVEFKKRFYWPITDKRSEASFRTNTVEYLKHINEKHKLQWGDIKSYLVVMPGGKKFITFLLDVVAFVVQEQIRLRERQLGADLDVAKSAGLNLKRMRRQNELLKVYSSGYMSSVDNQIELLRGKITNLQICFDGLARDTGLSKSKLMSKEFLAELKRVNREHFNENYVNGAADIATLEQLLNDLKDKIDEFQKKKAEMKYSYDKEKVRNALQLMSEASTTAEAAGNSNSSMENIKLNDLIIGMNLLQPVLEDAFSELEQTAGTNDFIGTQLRTLRDELQQIEAQITGFQLKLNTQMKKRANEKKQLTAAKTTATATAHNCNETNPLLMKYVCTPPIKLYVLGRGNNIRLPLLEDIHAKMSTDSFNSNLLTIPRSARKLKPAAHSLDHNNTMNKSRIIDPMQLLRTIHKDSTRVQKLPAPLVLGAQWRERQSVFYNDLENAPPTDDTSRWNISCNNNSSACVAKVAAGGHTSPSTPFNVNERTRISRAQLIETISSSSGSGGTNAKLFYSKRLSAVRKVQDDSLNFANMNTSPSGRLDALVPVDPKLTPKMKLNDITVEDEVVFFDKPKDGYATAVELLEMSTTCVLLTETTPKMREPLANQMDTPLCVPINERLLAQRQMANDNAAYNDDDDVDIFNISDSVLRDVLM